jgi:hypothetical protein
VRSSSGFRRAARRTPPPGAVDDTPYPPHPPVPAVPGYEVAYEIGVGGMSIVYLARQLSPDRPVALKVLHTAGVLDADGAVRFAEEARIVSFLRHKDIVQLYDVGEAGGLSYLSLEYVAGPTLARLVAGRPQDPRVSARMIEQIARAVQYAHEQGVIHRDLKPGNVLLAVGEGMAGPGEESASAIMNLSLSAFQPKVTDFGLAKALADSPVHTAAGIAVGTPGYMAPEQAAGDRDHVGPWTDVYALGVILYELVTGRLPFPGDDTPAVLLATRTQQPPAPRVLRPDLPRDLEAVILKALAKRPEDRYITATDFATDLRKFLDGQAVSALTAVGVVGRPGRAGGRSPLALGLLAAGLLVVGVGVEAVLELSSWVRGKKGAAVAPPPPTAPKPDPGFSKMNLMWAKMYVRNGAAANAEQMAEEGKKWVTDQEAANGPLADATIAGRGELADLMATLGRWDAAKTEYLRALAAAREAHGPAGPKAEKFQAALRDIDLREQAGAVAGGVARLPAALTERKQEP